MILYKVFDDKGQYCCKTTGLHSAVEFAKSWKGRVETENGKVVYQYKKREILTLEEVKPCGN